jgi:outer membrane protein assembly factor BamD
MIRFETKNSLGSCLMFAVLVLAGGQLAGCSGKDVNPEDPASLMEDAEADIKSDHYQIAIDKLRMLKNRFPYSKEAAIAQLRVGDVYFLQEAFGEASASYEAFRDQYPKHEKVSYAILRIGKSFESDIPENPGRDMGSATKAIESYQEYLSRFPQGAEKKEAQEAINKIRARLAEKEFSVALFYLRRGESQAARNRLTKVQSLYPETESARLAREKLATLPEEKAND